MVTPGGFFAVARANRVDTGSFFQTTPSVSSFDYEPARQDSFRFRVTQVRRLEHA